MVLTEPGLAGIVAAVREGRTTFQRIFSYTLNSITKKTFQVLFLTIGLIMTGHAILSPLLLAFCVAVLAFGVYHIRFSTQALQTLAFVTIVFSNQATTYTNRERRHLWSSRPGPWVIVSSIGDLLIASTLAVGGIAMTPLPILMVAGTFAAAVVFAFLLDGLKVPVFRRLAIT